MKILSNAPNFNIVKLAQVRNDNKYQSKSLGFCSDIISFGTNSYYKNAKTIYSAIANSKRVGILVHKDVDADALSSGVLFLKLLKRKYGNKDIQFIINQDIPNYLSKILYLSEITKYKNLQDKNFDTVIVLDCDDSRVDSPEIFDKANVKINIDHHANRDNNLSFKKPLQILNPEASSTTQLIYDSFFTPFGIKPNAEMIECIMTGIVTDTCNLKNIPNQLDFVMTMDSLENYSKKPVKYIINDINNKFNTSKQRSPELEDLYADTVVGKNICEYETPSGRKVNYIIVDKELLDTYKIKDNEADVKEIINSIVSMYKSKCDLSAALWERENGEIRLSLRSKNLDVLSIAEKFGGGGHRLAAGAPIDGNLDEAVEKMLKGIDAEV